MKPANRNMLMVGMLVAAQCNISLAAEVRGQLLCSGGKSPATGIAVTVSSKQGKRSAPFFTGGNGMYYLNGIPAGQNTLEVWLSKGSNAPTNTYPIQVSEPSTDIQPITVPACSAQ